jgi:hypothetical protein
MALKFDGKYLKESSKILCNVRGNTIFEGSGGSKPLANVRGDTIFEGSGGSKPLANVRGDTIFEGSGGSKPLIKTSDVARKIGATSRGPLTAAIWYLFCR